MMSAAGMFSPHPKQICTQTQATSLPDSCAVAQQYTLDELHLLQITPSNTLLATIRLAISAEAAWNPRSSCDLISVAIVPTITDSVICISSLPNFDVIKDLLRIIMRQTATERNRSDF
jgi:hypothetical protein